MIVVTETFLPALEVRAACLPGVGEQRQHVGAGEAAVSREEAEAAVQDAEVESEVLGAVEPADEDLGAVPDTEVGAVVVAVADILSCLSCGTLVTRPGPTGRLESFAAFCIGRDLLLPNGDGPPRGSYVRS